MLVFTRPYWWAGSLLRTVSFVPATVTFEMTCDTVEAPVQLCRRALLTIRRVQLIQRGVDQGMALYCRPCATNAWAPAVSSTISCTAQRRCMLTYLAYTSVFISKAILVHALLHQKRKR
jgi:hypothetical protein